MLAIEPHLSAPDIKEQLGGKGYNLFYLVQHGLAVPPAACLPASVYKSHLPEHIQEHIEQLIHGNPEDYATLLTNIQEGIQNIKLSQETEDAIQNFIDCLPKGSSIAVRSSGTLEDKAVQSFAGQYKTYLNNRTKEDIMRSIKKVWKITALKQSLYDAAVLPYLQAKSVLKQEPKMAVILQLQIDSKVAGVIFTQNPINGNAREIIVESVWGQGEGVVSSKITPDRFTIKRYWKEEFNTSIIQSKVIAPKTIKFALNNRTGGIEEVELSDEEKQSETLNESQLNDLLEIAKKIEETYQSPQDLEFALDQNNQVFILQARPITTSATLKEEYIKDPFKPSNPGPWRLDSSHFATPVSFFLAPFLTEGLVKGFKQSMDIVGLHFEMNVDIIHQFLFTQVAPSRKSEDLQRAAETSEKFWKENQLRNIVSLWNTQVKPMLISKHFKLQSVNISVLDDNELFNHLTTCVNWQKEMHIQHHYYDGPTLICVGDFVGQVSDWSNQKFTTSQIFQALEGFSPIAKGILSVDLHEKIHKQIESTPAIQDILVNSSLSPTEKLEKLKSFSNPEFNQLLNEFIGLNGFRIIQGYDVDCPIGCEKPEILIGLLRQEVNHSESNLSIEANKISDTIRNTIPEEFRNDYDERLKDARDCYCVREERSIFTDNWATGITHHVLLEVAKRLQKLGKISNADLIYEATFDEISKLILDPSFSIEPTLQERFAFRKKYTARIAPATLGATIAPPSPEFLKSYFPPFFSFLQALTNTPNSLPPAIGRNLKGLDVVQRNIRVFNVPEPQDGVIFGVGASPGVYEGTACVIHSPDDFGKLKSGDVLVTYCTSSAFNVLLPNIGAVVSDYGGILSHAAIVAREWNIPSVVGCVQAVGLIPQGARVIVDGDKGTVTLE